MSATADRSSNELFSRLLFLIVGLTQKGVNTFQDALLRMWLEGWFRDTEVHRSSGATNAECVESWSPVYDSDFIGTYSGIIIGIYDLSAVNLWIPPREAIAWNSESAILIHGANLLPTRLVCAGAAQAASGDCSSDAFRERDGSLTSLPERVSGKRILVNENSLTLHCAFLDNYALHAPPLKLC
jgi:hypothetical protein